MALLLESLPDRYPGEPKLVSKVRGNYGALPVISMYVKYNSALYSFPPRNGLLVGR
jgi:hypothetical protein